MKVKFLTVTFGITLVGFLMLLAYTPAPSWAQQTIKWRLSVWGTPRAWTADVEYWAKEMEKRTNGRFKPEIYWGAVLAESREHLDAVKSGLVDMAPFIIFWAPGKTPLTGVLNIPTLMPSTNEHLGLMVQAAQRNPLILKELEERWNAVPMLPTFSTQYQILSNRAVRTTDDLKGLRIRAGGMAGDLFREFGAVPSDILIGEDYEAQSKGMLDASYAGIYHFYSNRIYEVRKYLTIGMSTWVSNGFWVANKTSWDALPDDIKKVHEEISKESLYLMAKSYEATDNKAIEAMKAAGVEIIEFPLTENLKLSEKAEPYFERWVQEMQALGLQGRDVLDYMLAERKKIAGY